MGSEKKRQSSSDGPQAPKKKPKTTNIELQGVPNDGVYKLPLIQHQFCIWDAFFFSFAQSKDKKSRSSLFPMKLIIITDTNGKVCWCFAG